MRAGFELRDGTTLLLQDAEIQSVLEDLRVQELFSAALAWDRLYGGAAILMLVNDGGTLEDPLNEESIKTVEGLEVFEPPEIQVHDSYYYDDPYNPNYGKPEFYTLIGYNGNSFLVHESRLLVFKSGVIPTQKRRMRDGWGGKVFDELRENLLQYSAGNNLALMALSRMSQGILKLEGLTNNLENKETEKFVQVRLQLIDMVRHLMNTIAIDKEDDYDLKNMSLAGVKDVIEQFETALSAASDIPVTVLFGRSPGGLNSTGKADMENYYNLVRRIQAHVSCERMRTTTSMHSKRFGLVKISTLSARLMMRRCAGFARFSRLALRAASIMRDWRKTSSPKYRRSRRRRNVVPN